MPSLTVDVGILSEQFLTWLCTGLLGGVSARQEVWHVTESSVGRLAWPIEMWAGYSQGTNTDNNELPPGVYINMYIRMYVHTYTKCIHTYVRTHVHLVETIVETNI